MKILIDICHPAHVHFFMKPMALLKQRGHHIFVTSRTKEVATDLLDELSLEHRVLSAHTGGSPLSLLRELVGRDFRLYRTVREIRPDVMAAVGGIFVAHVGLLRAVPALVFYDTENAHLQNALTYPFAHRVYVPRCYRAWTPARTRRYSGYHELSYLHPKHFRPDRTIALENGLARGEETFLMRLVSWKSNHDIAESGWDIGLVRHTVARLSKHGKVLISAESDLPEEFSQYRYSGNPACLHHVLAFCRGYVGESATMASEAAVLGVPAVYAAHTRRGYTDEQEASYGLVRNVRTLSSQELDAAIDWVLNGTSDKWRAARTKLLEQTIDVAAFVADAIEHPDRYPLQRYATA